MRLYCSFAVSRNIWGRFQRFEGGIVGLPSPPIDNILILCYYLFHGICEIDLPFKLGVSVTRGNSCKLLRRAAIQTLRNTFIQIELYLRGTV